MKVIKLQNFICICYNQYGIVQKPFASLDFPPKKQYEDVARQLGIFQENDGDQVEIQRLDEIKGFLEF